MAELAPVSSRSRAVEPWSRGLSPVLGELSPLGPLDQLGQVPGTRPARTARPARPSARHPLPTMAMRVTATQRLSLVRNRPTSRGIRPSIA